MDSRPRWCGNHENTWKTMFLVAFLEGASKYEGLQKKHGLACPAPGFKGLRLTAGRRQTKSMGQRRVCQQVQSTFDGI